MRGIAVALLTLGWVVSGAIGAPVAEPDTWVIWSDDGPETPSRPAGGDIDTIETAPATDGLHLRLRTFDNALPPAMPSSGIAFQVKQTTTVEVSFVWEDTPRLIVDGAEQMAGWTVADGSHALAWHIHLQWDTLKLEPREAFRLQTMQGQASSATLQDIATGPDLSMTATASGVPQVSVAAIQPGKTIKGPDFGGGTSITVDGLGRPLVAYYIYDDARGDPRGIYVATLGDAGFVPERIADTAITRENGRDDQMRTQVVYDGTKPFVMFTDDPAVDNDEDSPGHLGTPDTVYVLAHDGQAWVREDPTPDGQSDVGPEDVSDLAARDGKVVAAVPVGPDVWIVERTGPDTWAERGRLEGANNAKIILDSEGTIHAAYVVYSADGNLRDGQLYYASSADAFEATHVGDNVSAGWEEPETDGSFAIAVGPADQIAIVWNDGRARERDEEQRVKILEQGGWTQEFVPLVPGHGNPQYTMRLGYTADGVLVAASGYGGTDTLASRAGFGAWTAIELPRYDVWDMAVSPAGSVYFGYTQPHGGTTVAVTAYGVGIDAGGDLENATAQAASAAAQAPGVDEEIPALGLTGLAALLGLALARRD